MARNNFLKGNLDKLKSFIKKILYSYACELSEYKVLVFV